MHFEKKKHITTETRTYHILHDNKGIYEVIQTIYCDNVSVKLN